MSKSTDVKAMEGYILDDPLVVLFFLFFSDVNQRSIYF